MPQDDVELQAHNHNHDHENERENTMPSTAPVETLAQTIAGVFRPKPHGHCEQCDVQLAARQRRDNERHCCNMVAATFMTLFVCAMMLGIIITVNVSKQMREKHD